ncbi:hypothetical protein QU665_08555 [Actinomyces oris]|uniref:Lipoprotein n=1 Tax=Actinomyces oris TaxID=544580 RepID=A0AAW9KVT1_9ACTO|nr:hypothetical protein [Actinomyces oris]MEA1305113.1 hypothetical protein [Actinomyces oris]
MARSLVCLAGRGRVASALGAGVLVGSLALVGCSSSSPKGGGTVPPVNTAGAGGGSSVSVSASGGASAGASGAASAGAVTAESLSDPDLGYTVVSIPKDLDATQTKVLQDYVAYDKATWRVWFTREGLDEALNRSTGSTHEDIQNSYEKMTAYDTPPVMIGVGGIDVSGDKQGADVTICSDRTQMKATDFQGNDVTQKSTQRRLAISVHMVPRDDGVWITQSETRLSVNECTAKAGK